ncbi:MAG: alpha/beta hydrolase [Myxococcota bacterium]
MTPPDPPKALDVDRLDPELAVLIPTLPEGLANITRDSVVALREALAANAPPPPPTDVVITQRAVPSTDGDVTVYVHRRPSDAVQPCLLWIHGGGYLLGSALDLRATWIAEALDVTVVSVEYRLAPEHPFPAGTEDCFAALQWTVEHADALSIDPARLAIGGASAGGGLAAGLALLNRDRGGPDLAMQLLIYPMIDNLHATPSGQIANHPVWCRRTSFNAWEMYLDGTPGEDASPYACATRATNLEGLPPAYVCVGAEDLFRDEDIDYARRLIAAGVPCELAVYPGLFHGADGFLPQARLSRRLEQGYQTALAHALGL